MSIHVALNHVTHYRYDRRVALGPQVVRLRPAPHCRTPILSYSLRVEPADHFVNWQQDPFANYLARLVFPQKTTEFKITVDLVAEMSVYNPFDFFLEPSAENFPFSYEEGLKRELAPYLVAGELTPLFKAFVDSVPRKTQRTIDFLVGLNQRLQSDISYLIRMEPGVQTPEQTLENRSGSCRDTGWLMVQALRHMGLAARFVSGYLIQLKPDVKALDGPSGAEADFTDLHAWCEVYLPGAGWIGLDPTSGLMAGEGHIPVACTPEPSSAAPVEGGVDESEVVFTHSMSVTRIHESPRVTKPYTEAQWGEVLSLGEQVDQQLKAQDVRLTQGGEPTFVSVYDREGAEWNTAALGPTKRGFANELVQRLRARYGEGGFLHFGQGKWYPGEQLPRWALSIFWRADGEPCWIDPTLFADERQPTGYSEVESKAFIELLARKLGLATDYIQAGYEDTWYYLWRERRLPVNVDPFDARLDDELERARLRKVFDQGLTKVVGYMLPIKREPGAPGLAGPSWTTGPWFFRDERMYLMPGDSPMGYRLPLDSLPWVTKGDYPYLIDADPFAPAARLRSVAALRAQYGEHAFRGPDADASGSEGGGATGDGGASARSGTAMGDAGGLGGAPGAGQPAGAGAGLGAGASRSPRTAMARRGLTHAPARFESAAWITRTAMCVEVRGGILYVFMPPLELLDDYLDLLAAVEATAEALGIKLVLEGYPPPRDARLKMLQVTPDPGVIEVNIHPASSWEQLVDHTEFLYEAAHETRLSTEKFMLDGRHTGTGGGNHFVLGGATPGDSPFLRRPDLLASLLAYWHNHPSLSYLFSGMFIGPTSQAPRIDEARNDQVFELEIALKEIENQTSRFGQVPPWMVDRTLRNILIDVTGNTHRAEFCIDKMYSPDGPTGRLGLLELRAFEMPPHARMSLVQQLLLRAMIARFWHTPYTGGTTTRLTRWGTELHDRFLLPTFVQMDFADVLAELRQDGFAFDPAWFAPHFEFRFPIIGEVTVAGIELTVRTALEPWHVMGEEGAPGGIVRYVDSSLERVEVKATGLNGNRHVVTVNGWSLPLQPTGRVGEFVAGVRYKAWAPPSALHPTIPGHAPLTFDIVDTWMSRSIGGCRYHVAHPGGRNHDSFPVNAYEAESRRLARFFKLGHTPGKMKVQPAQPSREFPFTLDLRHL
ncbi:transglutaminase family protein [Methylibium petroleiphilum]|uniref:Transglutaminase-like superfamily protein n=1 Tax=Methylibium petroleiphilum (strain ATCC BAA-1232 / LMG 22953 / PM1) TaxID=420662 RepID=A2SIW7_METPP|nr:transglutaminase family protein [Methylibium petroleiphilum]ABM95506.1 transglutaminase-like superfamily protein [Methylibium petroleiphilum PM1]